MWNIGSLDTKRNIIIQIEKSEQSISDEDDYSLSIKYSDNSEIINVIQTKVTTFVVTVKYDLSILY